MIEKHTKSFIIQMTVMKAGSEPDSYVHLVSREAILPTEVTPVITRIFRKNNKLL